MPYPEREIKTEPVVTGKFNQPPGRPCSSLLRALGKPPELVKKCIDRQVCYVMTTVKVDIAPDGHGGCDVRLTTTVTTIVTAAQCDPRTTPDEAEPSGALLQEYNKLTAEIDERERKEKEEKAKQAKAKQKK